MAFLCLLSRSFAAARTNSNVIKKLYFLGAILYNINDKELTEYDESY